MRRCKEKKGLHHLSGPTIKMVSNEEHIKECHPSMKPCSNEALKVLNEQEKQLKEKIMKMIIKGKANDNEVIRVCAWILNKFKRL